MKSYHEDLKLDVQNQVVPVDSESGNDVKVGQPVSQTERQSRTSAKKANEPKGQELIS